MIDFDAIELEIMGVISALDKFKSTQTGTIRETVPLTQMPCLDLTATGHKYNPVDEVSRYRVPIICVIRRQGVDRPDNAKAFKALVKAICTALESRTGTAYGVVREIESDFQEYDAGNGKMVRSGVLQFTVLA